MGFSGPDPGPSKSNNVHVNLNTMLSGRHVCLPNFDHKELGNIEGAGRTIRQCLDLVQANTGSDTSIHLRVRDCVLEPDTPGLQF